MVQLSFLVALALSGAGIVQATDNKKDCVKSTAFCKTIHAPRPTKRVPTYKYSLTLTRTRKHTTWVTPTVTITPKPCTTSVTVTKTATTTTTLAAVTDTITDTVTEKSTETDTATTTSVSTISNTVTVTSDGGTTTISASAGFTPVALETGYTSGTGYKRRNADVALSRPHLRSAPKQVMHNVKGRSQCKPEFYPIRVECLDIYVTTVKVTVTKTASRPKKTTLRAATKTVTKTTTSTSTVEYNPPHSQTTVTATTTDKSTITVTSTVSSTEIDVSTSTVNLPAATYDAVCDDPNNFVYKTPTGNNIDTIQFKTNFNAVTASNARDCCMACRNSPTCGFSIFSQSGTCYNFAGEAVCDATKHVGGFSGSAQSANYYTVSNGNCGQVTWQPQGPNSQF